MTIEATGNIYDRLGVTRRVNGAGLLTRLGGSLMAPEVLDAMREAAGAFVDIAELQTRASALIAQHTGAESGFVTSGAAAAITLATAACLTKLDIARMERLPDTAGMPNEVIIYRAHRTGYDHAIRAAGARIVEIGFNDRAAGSGVRGLEGWEIEAAIGSQTAAIAYAATPLRQPALSAVVAVAEKYRLPVIVDAAAQLPPKDNLKRFISEGASLVAFSGGKAIHGPQGTGILCGKSELVAAALIQQLDMDILIDTWSPPAGLLDRFFQDRLPHHGLGRGFKVDKESIVGLLIALERFVASDPEKEAVERERQLQQLAGLLQKNNHLRLELLSAAVTGRYPILAIHIDQKKARRSALDISRHLQRQSMPVHLSERRIDEGVLLVDAAGLRPGDETIIARSLEAALS